jgi:signal transduction histidine kinase
VAAFFIMRVLRSFEAENQRKIAELQASRLEEAERREALRGEMLRNVVTAQEAERQRIARELHDETGQALTAIGLGLRGVTTSLQQDGDKASHNLRQLERLVDHSLVELQRLIADLRPSHLDDLGLGAALRWYAGEIQNRVALNVSVSVIGQEPDLPSEIKTALFRIAQEALNNVVKHANANSAQVMLTYGERGVILQVADDGVGFDSKRINTPDRPSWGLVGMQERAKLVGGEFQLLSRPGLGTRVEVVLPSQISMDGGNDGDTPVVG